MSSKSSHVWKPDKRKASTYSTCSHCGCARIVWRKNDATYYPNGTQRGGQKHPPKCLPKGEM